MCMDRTAAAQIQRQPEGFSPFAVVAITTGRRSPNSVKEHSTFSLFAPTNIRFLLICHDARSRNWSSRTKSIRTKRIRAKSVPISRFLRNDNPMCATPLKCPLTSTRMPAPTRSWFLSGLETQVSIFGWKHAKIPATPTCLIS